MAPNRPDTNSTGYSWRRAPQAERRVSVA